MATCVTLRRTMVMIRNRIAVRGTRHRAIVHILMVDKVRQFHDWMWL
jgi:hypothetical protein